MTEFYDLAVDYTGRLKDGIEWFLESNRYVLSEWQLEVCKKILDPDTDEEDLMVVQQMLAQKIDILTKANWSPAQSTKGDMVDRPNHYARIPVEPTKFSQEHGLDWVTANPLKYVCRFPFKNGIEDLRKALRYNAMRIRWLQGDPKWSE